MNITHLAFFFFPGASEIVVGVTQSFALELQAISAFTPTINRVATLDFEEPSAGTLLVTLELTKAEVTIYPERRPIRFRN